MTTCPFCNATLSADPTRQTACPRCGEIVPTAATNPAVASPGEPPIEASRISNGRLGLYVVGTMVAMAAIGLAYALMTVKDRRAHDFKGREISEPQARESATGPMGLSGIGYIPSDTHVLLGLDVQQLRANPAGMALARKFAALDETLVSRTTDHVLVGLNLKAVPPRVTLYLRGTRPIDRGLIFIKSQIERGGRTIERLVLPTWKVEGSAYLPDERTLIGTQFPEDFDRVPNPPAQGIERFTHLHAILAQRLDPRAIGWLVGQVELDNAALPALANLLRLSELQNVRGMAFTFRADGPDLAATLDMLGRDSAATTSLADWLERSLGAAGVVARRQADGDWQRLTAKLNAEAMANWFAK